MSFLSIILIPLSSISLLGSPNLFQPYMKAKSDHYQSPARVKIQVANSSIRIQTKSNQQKVKIFQKTSIGYWSFISYNSQNIQFDDPPYIINVQVIMEKEIECTKIKDGLYLGNFRTAQDAEFLVTNRFAYVVNCSLETPNYYEGQGIKYLKFKLGKDKPHKLWDQSLKKLKKLDKFIETSEQNSMCCLIHSFDGSNRSLTMLVAFLMNRFKWCLSKTLEFIRSKDIFIGLSQHYIEQLQKLEQILNNVEPALSKQWRIEYSSQQQQIISKTYLNSLQIEYKVNHSGKKKQKRVIWKDIIDKEKKKEQKQNTKPPKTQKQTHESQTPIYLTKKNQKIVENREKPKLKKQTKKTNKSSVNKSKGEIGFRNTKQTSLDGRKNNSCQNHSNRISFQKQIKKQCEFLDGEDQILKLIKKNLKGNRKNQETSDNVTETEQQPNDKIYNVTINNYIKPNINILNNLLEQKPIKNLKNEKKKTKAASSTWNKGNVPSKEKINRTMSEKQGIRSNNNTSFKEHIKEKSVKNIGKKGLDRSPRRNIKKNQKTTSFHKV